MAFLTFCLGSGHPQTRFSSNVTHIHISEILECLEKHMSGSQACRGSPHGPIEKEISHLKAEINKSFLVVYCARYYFTVLFAYVYVFSFYSITPLCPCYVCSNPTMIIFSAAGHHLALLCDRT